MKNRINPPLSITQDSLYQSIQDFYSSVEAHTQLAKLQSLKKLFDVKNLFLEFLDTNILSQKEKDKIQKIFEGLSEEFLVEMISIEDSFERLQKLLSSLEETNLKSKILSNLQRLATYSIDPEEKKLLQQRLSSIKDLLKQEKISQFNLSSLVKNLDRIRKIFDQRVLSPQELLTQLDSTLRSFKSA